MRRLARHMLRALTVLSLALPVAVAALGIRSYWRRTVLTRLEVTGTWANALWFSVNRGKLTVSSSRWEPLQVASPTQPTVAPRYSYKLASSKPLVAETHGWQWERYGFAGFRVTQPAACPYRQNVVTELSVPPWPAALTLAPGAALAARRLARRRQLTPGLCPRCRYDLTGNVSGVCPECGTPAAAAEATGGRKPDA